MTLEEERKYDVAASFILPELAVADTRPAARAAVTLTATYFDTAGLRLARAGASLRHRVGDALPWTVKLPTAVPGVRQEVSLAGADPSTPPEALTWLVAALTRGSPLMAVAVLRTRRQRVDLCDADGARLAEVADDTVEVLSGTAVPRTFREIEVERTGGSPALLSAVEELLVAAGARAGGFTPKLVRALGAAAAYPPDLLPPAASLPATARAADVVLAAVRGAVARIVTHDPLVRLDEPLPGGDTAVHQMRVGVRRLRSDLRTFKPLLDQRWAGPLRTELRWLGDLLGAARDAEVLHDRLRATAAADPEHPAGDLAALDAILAARRERAYADLLAAMRTRRYLALLERLTAATRRVPLSPAASAPAAEALPGLLARPWHRLVHGGKGVPGAARLKRSAPDVDWHEVRIHVKRARYAAEAAASTGDRATRRLAKSLARLQDTLGEHTDAALAAATWRALAKTHPGHAATLKRLARRERALAASTRAAYPGRWRKTAKRGAFLSP
ncbi:CHAD domain-containing protein [Catellatospora methionotrophica]|uniref:CHAD domain-containing protein n=1 Tax=Catellatospora methionotrophica TaxID=121620 RepID=A0A8J3PHW5_9ACTN|nr:CYTH and CHAD domain-containing protein [Catellatospora methionotrophica]GIG17822.1 CHAD domain-containing protein [Catellatospora methionotrophica]